MWFSHVVTTYVHARFWTHEEQKEQKNLGSNKIWYTLITTNLDYGVCGPYFLLYYKLLLMSPWITTNGLLIDHIYIYTCYYNNSRN
jgi:hypothetical protein